MKSCCRDIPRANYWVRRLTCLYFVSAAPNLDICIIHDFQIFLFVENTSRIAMVHSALNASILLRAQRILKLCMWIFACRWLVNVSGSTANVWDGSKKIRSPHQLHKTAGLGKLSPLSKQLSHQLVRRKRLCDLELCQLCQLCQLLAREMPVRKCASLHAAIFCQEKCGLHELINMARMHSISMDASHQLSATTVASYLYLYSCRRQWPKATIADACAGWLRKLSKFRMSWLTRQGCVQLRLERRLFVDFFRFPLMQAWPRNPMQVSDFSWMQLRY